MATYTDLHNKIKETVNVDYPAKDRVTTQHLKLHNMKNEYWGIFSGQLSGVSAENMNIVGGTISASTLVNSTFLSCSQIDKLSSDVKYLFEDNVFPYSRISVDTDLVVAGVSIGSYGDNDVISAGTRLNTVIYNMLRKAVNPTQYYPIRNDSWSEYYQDCELGEVISVGLSSELIDGWYENPYGDRKYQFAYVSADTTFKDGPNQTVKFSKDLSSITTLSSFIVNVSLEDNPDLIPNLINNEFRIVKSIGITKTSYSGSTNTIYDNIGTILSGNDLIPAGTISGSINSIFFYRKMYKINDSELSSITTKEELFALPNNLIKTIDPTEWSLPINPTNKRFVIAYPKSLGNLNKIERTSEENSNYLDINGAGVSKGFVKTELVNINGANNFSPVTYNIYTYMPTIAFNKTDTFNFKF